MHWGDLFGQGNAINYLTISATDTLSKQPELKFCAVAVEKAAAELDAGGCRASSLDATGLSRGGLTMLV